MQMYYFVLSQCLIKETKFHFKLSLIPGRAYIKKHSQSFEGAIDQLESFKEGFNDDMGVKNN